MIIVYATITAKPGKRAELLNVAQPCIRATRQEAGNRQYDCLASTENADAIAFFERWDSREALAQHMESPHMQAFAKAKEALQEGELGVAIYDIA